MSQKLSVVIITKNEEDKIRECLESVKWVDEIVIVDGYSADRTVEICRQYTDKIVQNKHDGNFDKERNLGTDTASGDWVLQLDADERVTPELHRDIEKILADDNGYSAYKFKRKNFFLGHFMRYGGWYHDSLHFFRRTKARYKGRIHETLYVDGPIGQIESGVEHYPFESLSVFVARHNRYSDKEAQKIYETFGIVSAQKIRYHICVKPLKLFWKMYVKKKGYKEGVHGFVFSFLFAWVHFLNWSKYWELLSTKQFSTDILCKN